MTSNETCEVRGPAIYACLALLVCFSCSTTDFNLSRICTFSLKSLFSKVDRTKLIYLKSMAEHINKDLCFDLTDTDTGLVSWYCAVVRAQRSACSSEDAFCKQLWTSTLIPVLEKTAALPYNSPSVQCNNYVCIHCLRRCNLYEVQVDYFSVLKVFYIAAYSRFLFLHINNFTIIGYGSEERAFN
jgi:hypothetical protein